MFYEQVVISLSADKENNSKSNRYIYILVRNRLVNVRQYRLGIDNSS